MAILGSVAISFLAAARLSSFSFWCYGEAAERSKGAGAINTESVAAVIATLRLLFGSLTTLSCLE